MVSLLNLCISQIALLTFTPTPAPNPKKKGNRVLKFDISPVTPPIQERDGQIKLSTLSLLDIKANANE